jgi:hypothetical protein
MAARKETSSYFVLPDGRGMTMRMLDGIIIDDLLVQGAKAEGYRVITGLEAFPEITRKTTDYLLRIGVIQE